MNSMTVYHVVTDKPMYLGQHIVFNEENHNGVYNRVMDKLDEVKKIYNNPDKYDIATLEHHTKVALRELTLEKIRKETYSSYPSRMSCLYVSESLEEAIKWAELFVSLNRPTYSIVKLKVTGNIFVGDANNCFDATTDDSKNLLLAHNYWLNMPNLKNCPPIKEYLVDGDIEVVEIMRIINKNLSY